MKKILIVSQYFYPDEFRINDIVKRLCDDGYQVTVLTGKPDYATGRIPDEYKGGIKKEEFSNAEVIRVPTAERKTGILHRILNYSSFTVCASAYSIFAYHGSADVVFSYQLSPVFQILPARILSKKTKSPLVVYCLDLWPESLKAWNVCEGSPIFKLTKHISSKLYKGADRIAVTSRYFADYLTGLGVDRGIISYIPQHAEDLFSSCVDNYTTSNDETVFLFAGNLGAAQGTDCIIKAASMIRTDKKFKIVIAGSGSKENELKGLADELGVSDRIVFTGRVKLEQMKELYLGADICLLTLSGSGAVGATLPAKLQGYMSAGRPVLASADGEVPRILEESKAGNCVASGDCEGLARLMEEAISDKSAYRHMGINAAAYYKNNFNVKTFIGRLTELFNQTLSEV